MPIVTNRTEPEFTIHTDLHEGHFTPDEVAKHSTDGDYMSLMDAHTIARKTAEKLLEARKVALANTMQTEAANLEQFARAHDKALEQTNGTLEATINRANQSISAIEAELAEPIAAPKNAGTASDIRAHVKGLSHEERRSFIAEAVASGDEETVTAVLSAPGYLSGLSKVETDHYRDSYKRAQNPELHDRLELLKKTESKVRSAAQRLAELSGKIHRHDTQKTLAAKNADAAARQALHELTGR